MIVQEREKVFQSRNCLFCVRNTKLVLLSIDKMSSFARTFMGEKPKIRLLRVQSKLLKSTRAT